MMVETYLRRGRRELQRLMLDPGLRRTVMAFVYGGGSFLLSAAALADRPQPLAMGLICAGTGWQAVFLCLGAMVGYPVFWGMEGRQGIVWSASAGLLALMLGSRAESKEQPLMIPAITAFLMGVAGLVFSLLLQERTPPDLYFFRIALTFGTGILFTQWARQRDGVSLWILGGMTVLTLAGFAPFPWLNLGYVTAGIIAIRSSFPAAVLAGLGLDLARVTAVPMTAVLSAAGLIRLIPFDRRWQHYASAGFACVTLMAACGIWDPAPLPGLLIGGGIAALLPPQPDLVRRRGDTGAAQVQLELSASVMGQLRQTLLETPPAYVDQQALLDRAAEAACGGCAARNSCTQREKLTAGALQDPMSVTCRKPGRLRPELRRASDQLRVLQRERMRQGEYRSALVQQYGFLESYLRSLADRLPRSGKKVRPAYRVEAAARSREKERANGDRCLAFPGPGCRFYLLLCDGMGTGLGAACEGDSAAALLKQLLGAGFPPEHALRTLNSLLILRGLGGAVTVDLAQIQLDTGLAAVYKWGAAPSWVLRRHGAEKIGTAAPPPGITLEGVRETVDKLSLCRGEPLILLSDGVDGEDVLHRLSVTPDAPPGELAADILEKSRGGTEDDATAAVIRLRPICLESS